MIKLEKRLMPWCEECEDFSPCSMKVEEKQDDNSFEIKAVIMCTNADICINAVHQYQKTCENTPIIKENETVVDQNKTLDEQGLPSCRSCEFYNVDFSVCGLLMLSNIDLDEYICCTEYKKRKRSLLMNKELKRKINNKMSELLELTSKLNNDEKREFIEELEDLLDIEEE